MTPPGRERLKAPGPARWPAVSMAEALAQLTAPGAPFEMRLEEVQGRPTRVYAAAPATLWEVFDDSRRFGDRPLLAYRDERVSFEAHWRAAAAFARALRTRFGVRKGDRVAIAMRNYPEWSVCAWGALAVGAVLVPLNAWEGARTLEQIITLTQPALVVADGERAERLAVGAIPLLIARSAPHSLEAIIGRPSDYAGLPDVPLARPDLLPDDDAVLFCTSGTTGAPKATAGTHRNVLTNLVNTGFRAARAAVRRGDAIPLASGAERRQLLPLPLFHVTGFHSALAPALANGATLFLMHKWDVEQALDLIEAERINALTLVPSQALELTRSPSLPGRELSSVDTVGYGGAPAPPQLAAAVQSAFPKATPGQGYGATETSSLVAANSAEDMLARPESVGVAAPICDLRLTDETGRDVPAGAPGELWVRGANVVRGYWNDPDATAGSFVGGWYRTGDLATVDDEGFITILDRAKDMLIRGGENIYCVEIENVLLEHPAVAEVAVVGLPHEVLGEVVGAVVVRLDPGSNLSAHDLIAFAASRLPPHKRPVAISWRAEPLPRNAAGKILKRQLAAESSFRSV